METENIKIVGLDDMADQIGRAFDEEITKIAGVVPSSWYPLSDIEELQSKLLDGYMHVSIATTIDEYCNGAQEAMRRPWEELPLMINAGDPQQIIARWRLAHEKPKG